MILEEEPLNFIDLPLEDSMNKKQIFTRSNIPTQFKEWRDAKRAMQSK